MFTFHVVLRVTKILKSCQSWKFWSRLYRKIRTAGMLDRERLKLRFQALLDVTQLFAV